MCDFISWVEHDGEILFLTDEKVFSHSGIKLLNGCRDNDFIGHGAIRKYFFLEPNDGIDREIRDFWNTEKLPEPLKTLLATPESFFKVWGKMFSKYFSEDDLVYIIRFGPEPYKSMACEELFKKGNVRYGYLIDIIIYCTEPYKSMAYEELLKRGNVHNSYLINITIHCTEPYKSMAYEKLLEKNCSNSNLTNIIIYGPEPYKNRAWLIFLKNGAPNYCLRDILKYAPEPYKSIAKGMLKHRAFR